MVYERGDVVSAPFRFSEIDMFKTRPVVVVSNSAFYGETGSMIVAMITSANRSAWPFDLTIADWAAAGLAKPCLIRLKLATIALETTEGFIGRIDGQTLKELSSRLTKLIT